VRAGCNEPTEDCSNGKISTCNEGCAKLILPLWTSCRKELGPAASVLKGTIALCQAVAAPGGDSGGSSGSGSGGSGTTGGSGSSAHQVKQFAMVCAEGEAIKNCVPPCTQALNGDELLLNIFGEDPSLRFGPVGTVFWVEERIHI
jgi:hypothetical protein